MTTSPETEQQRLRRPRVWKNSVMKCQKKGWREIVHHDPCALFLPVNLRSSKAGTTSPKNEHRLNDNKSFVLELLAEIARKCYWKATLRQCKQCHCSFLSFSFKFPFSSRPRHKSTISNIALQPPNGLKQCLYPNPYLLPTKVPSSGIILLPPIQTMRLFLIGTKRFLFNSTNDETTLISSRNWHQIIYFSEEGTRNYLPLFSPKRCDLPPPSRVYHRMLTNTLYDHLTRILPC